MLKAYAEKNLAREDPIDPRDIRRLFASRRAQFAIGRRALLRKLGDEILVEAAMGDQISAKFILRGKGLGSLEKAL